MKDIVVKITDGLLSRPDRLSGSVLVLTASFAIFEASRLPFGTLRTPDAGFFPLCLSVLLLVLGVGIVVRSYAIEPQPVEFPARAWYVLVAAAAFVLYALVVQIIGFLISTVVVMLLLMRGLGGMSWTRALVIAVSGVVLSYLGFLELGVPLPRGISPF